MKNFLPKAWSLLAIYCLMQVQLSAQFSSKQLTNKPPLNTSDLFGWPNVTHSQPQITADGKYVFYSVENVPVGGSTSIIQAIDGTWKQSIEWICDVKFTMDSKKLIYSLPGDSLCLMTLGTSRNKIIAGIHGFSLFKQGKSEWLALKKEKENKLVLHNLNRGSEMSFINVKSYQISKDGCVAVLLTTLDAEGQRHVLWVDLLKNFTKKIWSGKNVRNFVMNESKKVAFLEERGGAEGTVVWFYEDGKRHASPLINDSRPAMRDGMLLKNIREFTTDGERLLLILKQDSKWPPDSSLVAVNIWSYNDLRLQSEQLLEAKDMETGYLAVVDLNNPGQIRRLQVENESVSIKQDYGLAYSRKGNGAERYWNRGVESKEYLVTISTGDRIRLPIWFSQISPTLKYAVGYLQNEGFGSDLYAFDIKTGNTKNLTAAIPRLPTGSETTVPYIGKKIRLAAWCANDEVVLVYDQYDLWLISLDGTKLPANLTCGRDKLTEFRLAEKVEIINDQRVLLTAFNESTKQAGFYRLNLGRLNRLEKLCMGNFMYGRLNYGDFLWKAKDANVYVVRRESVSESPNLFITRDFKKFTPLSHITPEKKVNWMTSELFEFTTVEGVATQAILYKPENLDPKRKYPVIIHYYEKKSDLLNKNWKPQGDGTGGDLDIAWFVSHGYLVCLTDIHFKVGKPGESALQAVEGAARHLSRRPYVDQDRIGVQGHSFGGYETNYIATHSKMFAAAVSSSGLANTTGCFGSLWPDGSSVQSYVERRGFHMYTTPWEAPDLYVKNSPVYSTDKVSTPLLLVGNQRDKNVPFYLTLEYFTALRRAGKRAWMLEYDNGGHGVFGKEYKDYLLRMTQFFDHYLKGAPAPRWMLYGIPARERGYTDGMELVTEKASNGKWLTPGPGLLREDLK